MKIKSIEVREIKAKLPGGFSGGTYELGHRAAQLCRITTDEGLTSEISVGNTHSYDPGIKALIRGAFREALVGQDPLLVEKHWHTMMGFSRRYGTQLNVIRATSVVDVALWNLKGLIMGQPLWRLIGGARPTVPIIGIGGYYQTSGDEKGIREEVAFFKREGAAGVKFKVGAKSLEEDAERVRICRDAGGPDYVIVVDSNQAWTPRDAAKFAEMILPYNPEWLEEPVHWSSGSRGLREVRLKTGIRIGAGQSERSVYENFEFLTSGAVDVLNQTIFLGGGITPLVRLAGAAALADVGMAQVAEPHLGVHLMAGVWNSTFVEYYPNADRDPFWTELYPDRPKPANGFITAPNRPGVGLTLDRDAVERYAIEPWS